MRRLGLCALVGLLWATPAVAVPHWEADLTWVQAAPATETGSRVEFKLGTTGTYATKGTVAAAVRAFTDVGPYTDGQVVCWRVVALHPTTPNVGDESCSGAPVQFPGKPGAPSINWRFIPQ